MQFIHFETWQIVLLIFGGLLYIVFSVLKSVKNNKAKKAKKASGVSLTYGDPGSGMSLHIDPDPDMSEGGSDG